MNTIKRICLVTWYGSNNYGTNLQVYATKIILEKLGYTCHLIRPFEKTKFSTKNTLHCYILELKKVARKILFCKSNKTHRKKQHRLDSFLKDNFNYTRMVTSTQSLRKLNNEYDVFLTGSDQIWNPYFLNTFNMLDFVNENKKKISYSSSIAVSEIPKEKQNLYKQLLGRFSHLSCREKTGSKVLSALLNRNVTPVLDPTFLLTEEDWELFGQKADLKDLKITGEYILNYFIGDSAENWDALYKIQKETQIENIIVVCVSKSKYNTKGTLLENIGPYEFVWLIQHAKLICTDSFHATVISIALKKDFIDFLRFGAGDKKSEDSRILDPLNRYGLSHRLYQENNTQYLNSIDYSQVYRILQKDRDASIQYLLTSINS